MTTFVFDHPSYGTHETPDGHPECGRRHSAVIAALGDERFAGIVWRESPLAETNVMERVHGAAYVARVQTIAPPRGDFVRLDPDTYMGPSSLEASMRAAGGAVAAVDAVYAGEAANAFVPARPPGHHAEPERAMGFGWFNSAAIAALHAREAHGAARVAVVDFDVHHGNGTEAAFWHEATAFYGSSHEWPQYPGTGRPTDRGAFGNIVNAPLPTGADGKEFRRAWGDTILPALSAFRPDFIVISAGFDAHRADPVGGLRLVEDDFRWVTKEILTIAAECCCGRVVSVLEGGYDLPALGRSTAAHLTALMDG